MKLRNAGVYFEPNDFLGRPVSRNCRGSLQIPETRNNTETTGDLEGRNASDELTGIRFFSYLRQSFVDCFFTSQAGIHDLGYVGNQDSTALTAAAKRSSSIFSIGRLWVRGDSNSLVIADSSVVEPL